MSCRLLPTVYCLLSTASVSHGHSSTEPPSLASWKHAIPPRIGYTPPGAGLDHHFCQFGA